VLDLQRDTQKKETAFAETKEHRVLWTTELPQRTSAPAGKSLEVAEKKHGPGDPKEKVEEEEEAAAKCSLASKNRVAYPLMCCLARLYELGRSAAASAGSGPCCHHEALELLLRRRIANSQLARVGRWTDGGQG
jgi:hypothetical protein